MLLGTLAHAAIVPGLVFRSKATNTQVEIKYDGATLTVPQHCRQDVCDATQSALAAATSKIDSATSALQTSVTNNANYIAINSNNIATLQTAMIAENTRYARTSRAMSVTSCPCEFLENASAGPS